jgi:hypothetical protein
VDLVRGDPRPAEALGELRRAALRAAEDDRLARLLALEDRDPIEWAAPRIRIDAANAVTGEPALLSNDPG